MVIYLSFFYLVIGIIFLLVPLLYLELGKPRDLIKGGCNLVVAMFLFIKRDVFDHLYSLVLVVITILFTYYLVEIFSLRWNQLTIQEKNKLKTIVELKKNLLLFSNSISSARKDFLNSNNFLKFWKNKENLNEKKWVRKAENDNIVN